MSKQYPGGIISKTAPVPSGPYADSTAPGIWTLEQQAYWQKLGQWPTQGAVNLNLFIENLFSTYLYSGNSSTQTITNGIDLSTNGGLVWVKGRNETFYHRLASSPGPTLPNYVASNATDAASSGNGTISAFTTTGFTVSAGGGGTNTSGYNYVGWTFRKQAKFFDVVTYTGNQTAGRTVAHNLGSVPGFIVCKRTDTPEEWFCYHRSLGPSQQILLNSTALGGTNNNQWSNTAPTSSVFSLGTDSGANGTGGTYVAYLFAHDAGGFGLSGTDNVISCGTYTGNGSTTGPVITLGYEPQWVLIKRTSGGTANWVIFDTARGMSLTAANLLYPNVTDDEGLGTVGWIQPTATGFQPGWTSSQINASGNTYIYVAIRKGPMQVPTVGTSVFQPQLYTGTGSSQNITGPTNAFQYDSLLQKGRSGTLTSYAGNGYWVSKLQLMSTSSGQSTGLGPAITAAEVLGGVLNYTNTGFTVDAGSLNLSGTAYVNYWFRRAPSFMDVVCYTGTGSSMTISHNLGVSPELIIGKSRSAVNDWDVSVFLAGFTDGVTSGYLNAANAFAQGNGDSYFDPVSSTTFTHNPNTSARTYIAYLFATCAGVSKVGSYTGTGATQTINCGFTTGARFVLIKRTDSTGDWYVWDSARGIIPANDPYLLVNSTAAEVTGTDYIDTTSVGFDVTSTAPAGINANGGTYIFLAIA
jgi:hypothetical protein